MRTRLRPGKRQREKLFESSVGYQHVWGGYLALARHFEAVGDAEQAAIYNERFHHFCRFELDLWKLSDDEKWRHQEQVLPPLIKELHALEKEFLGYQRTGLPPA